MAQNFYTSEENHQILIALLKAHNIRKIIASPGATNVSLVGSIQKDDFFEMYSSVDERSAGYIACGMAAESGEPVVLSCTGATASRNYYPPLTEAFYRKLPVLAVTSSQHFGRVGTYTPQVTNRFNPPKDVVKFSASIPLLHTQEDTWAANLKINEALLELRRNGGGPVHLNMMTDYSQDFSIKKLPAVNVIRRFESIDLQKDNLPELKVDTVGIFIGAHSKFDDELTRLVDLFCEKYNAVVLTDHTGNYNGKYEINPNLIPATPRKNMNVLIHLGEVSGAYMSFNPGQVWRVNPDGELRDPFKRLKNVFQMSEKEFFGGGGTNLPNYYLAWRRDYDYVYEKIPELPFSNIWIAQHTIKKLPANSVLHLGILNSLRSWNYFEFPKNQNICAYSNTGGFGIDGCMSSFLGASLASPDKLFFGVIGDLAFFYDMNATGNRHLNNNFRLMLVNNGTGVEMHIYPNGTRIVFQEGSEPFFEARGNFAKQSKTLLKNYVETLGFEYISASSKEEYLANYERFMTPEKLDKPLFFEIFINPDDESDALKLISEIDVSEIVPASMRVKKNLKRTVKNVIGVKNARKLKKMLGR